MLILEWHWEFIEHTSTRTLTLTVIPKANKLTATYVTSAQTQHTSLRFFVVCVGCGVNKGKNSEAKIHIYIKCKTPFKYSLPKTRNKNYFFYFRVCFMALRCIMHFKEPRFLSHSKYQHLSTQSGALNWNEDRNCIQIFRVFNAMQMKGSNTILVSLAVSLLFVDVSVILIKFTIR